VQKVVQLVYFKVSYKLPDDDSFGIETCSIVEWPSFYRVVFELDFCSYANILTQCDDSEYVQVNFDFLLVLNTYNKAFSCFRSTKRLATSNLAP